MFATWSAKDGGGGGGFFHWMGFKMPQNRCLSLAIPRCFKKRIQASFFFSISLHHLMVFGEENQKYKYINSI
jgi:hypothetical protein